VEQPGWIGHRHVAEERTDRGKPRVAAARTVAARGLAMNEEVGDQIGVNAFDRELDWRFAVPSARDLPRRRRDRSVAGCARSHDMGRTA